MAVSEEGIQKLQEFISRTRKVSSEVSMNQETQQLKNELLELSKRLVFKSSEQQAQRAV
jgi:hypothetical protein